MTKVDYSKDQPERFLRWIENQEKQIRNISNQLVDLLSGIGGVDESMIEDIKAKVIECLQTRKKSEQELDAEKIRETYNELNSLHNQYKNSYNKPEEQLDEKLDENQKISKEIDEFCENFKNNIEWVTNTDTLINRLKNLIEMNELKINKDSTWKEIYLSCLDYEIKILNLWNYPEKEYNITPRNSNIDPDITNYETDKNGMNKISSHCAEWRKVATQTDIQNILKRLVAMYSLRAGREWSIHDEDIAFFMLMTQSDWEFLLKKDNLLGKNKVLKMYPKYRWFKDMKDDWTGQIILIRKKQ